VDGGGSGCSVSSFSKAQSFKLKILQSDSRDPDYWVPRLPCVAGPAGGEQGDRGGASALSRQLVEDVEGKIGYGTAICE
jgi:hypothetical protein